MDIEELRRLEKKATPAPWEWRDDVNSREYDLSPGILSTSYADGTPWGDSRDKANAALIVAMRNALPELLSQHEQLIERVLRYATDYVPRKDYDKLLKALEAAERNLETRDKFLVERGVWDDFVNSLPPHGGVDVG